MEKEEARKGPWTEQEDVQLVFYVNLFGDRRWDFIAKVSGLKVGGRQNIYRYASFGHDHGTHHEPKNKFNHINTFVVGLNRTGKSCRLRWVNYLHPGLKRGKMTPHEERLVLELHSKWGNRWSRIARKLPGRTDNEIKNYWRTHMRKQAQGRKKRISLSSSSSSSSSNSSSSSISDSPRADQSTPVKENNKRSFYDTGGVDLLSSTPGEKKIAEAEESNKVYSMDDIWEDFEFSEGSCKLTCQTVASPIWDYCPTDSLWSMDEEESKMLMQLPMGDHFQSFPFCNYMTG